MPDNATVSIREEESGLVHVYSTKGAAFFSSSIANVTTSSNFSLGSAGVYEMTVISEASMAAAPHQVQLRNASSANILIVGCGVASSVTRRFRTSEDGLIVQLRNGNSSGAVTVWIVLVGNTA